MKSLLLSALCLLPLAPAGAEEPAATVESGGLVFTGPSSAWQKKAEPSAMSQGGFTYTQDGKTADADIYFFGAGQGGDVDANVTRWKGRFEGEPEFAKKSLEAGGKTATLVVITGTYLAGSAFGPKTPTEGQTLLGAIVPGAEANVFIRMVGDSATVAAAKAEFEKMISDSLTK